MRISRALKLQKAGLIRYHRGSITVLDRIGLERVACECYTVVRDEYDRLLPVTAVPCSTIGLIASYAGRQTDASAMVTIVRENAARPPARCRFRPGCDATAHHRSFSVAVENRLIELLPRRERVGLLSICQRVELVLSEVLFEVRDPTSHVYFPVDGFVSLVASVDTHSALEVGMVGREGMVGVEVLLGESRAPLRAVVQGAGFAWRIPVPRFRKALAESPALRLGMNRYVAVLMAQLASSAACVRYHLVGARLARWLLMTQDRSHADHFYITQEFIAFMLGVRRVSVTSAAGILQREGLVKYSRGEIKVLDRAGLEAAACSCYATDQTAYAGMSD